ncbi:Puromycin-sensitive aminopeptidase [Exaiptasia diaphana]|nr:Puromycin-sensitive aminopeptidase [Exaiptasia diaphana]
MSSERKPFERLPASVVPRNYNLSLQPDLKEFVFKGNEVVSVEVTKTTSEVILNCVDIAINSAKFTSGDVDLTAGDINYSKDDETATLVFPSDLPVGNGSIHLDFTGELNDKMKGFYRSKYIDNGQEKYCAVTQFEPTDARRAFPCWDEPAIKATFDVTLVVPKDLVALSNMNVIEENPADDPSLKIVKYAQTPIMSTYLLAFVVGEYDYVEDQDQDGVLVRVYTPKGKSVQGKFALEVAVKTLPFYKEYFGISYPLPKMDLIAIADFAAGAMENWGLVTYRETALLIDPENSSSATKQWVALVVDTVFVIAGVTGSVTGRELAWTFVKENWSYLHDSYEGGFLLSRLVKCTTENFASEEKAKEIEQFFAKHSVAAAERTVQQSLENVRLNIAWLSRDADSTKAWLQSKGF